MTTEAYFDRLQGLHRLDPALRSAAMSLHASEFLPDTVVGDRDHVNARSARLATGIDTSGVSVEPRRIVGPRGDALHVQIYRSLASGPLPVVIYAHGGASVTEDLEPITRPVNSVTFLLISVKLAPREGTSACRQGRSQSDGPRWVRIRYD